MEFCPHCQKVKPYRVVEYLSSKMAKVCRDCGFSMGYLEIEGINAIINELNFYKNKFYKTELESCKKSQE